MTTPPQTLPPGAGPKGAGGKLAAAAGGRRNLLLAAGLGTAVVAFVMSRGGKGGDSGTGSDQQMTGYDSTSYDQYNAVQSQLEDIQRQIDEGKVTPGTPVTPTPTTASPKPTPVTLPWRPTTPTPIPKPTTPVKKPAPATPKKYVTIARGDTLSAIAKKSGISMSTLKKLNPKYWTEKKYNKGNTIWSGGKVRVK